FAELGTATWCGYCQYAHGALKNIYAGGWHPFYYVSLVDDVNVHAEDRIDELVISGFPTVWFDGGYKTNVGAGSVESAQALYNTSLISCGEREVFDIDIDLDVTWNGDAEMDIYVTIDNNEDSSYSGHLHVYVTEIQSSMGWTDTGGYLYTFPFLDYAFNQDITISSGGTWSNSKNWDGDNYNNGYGDDFGGISYGNIMVIGTVFDDEEEYVDDTTGYRVGNNADPYTPSNPDPEDGDTEIIVETDLSWICSDPDFDVLSYDIYLGESSDPPLIATDIPGRTYTPGLLDFSTKYYWKIVANDPQGGSTTGPVWDFTTRSNDAPNSPSNPNPANGASDIPINTCLSWTCEDPDGDDVTYDVYFGKNGEDLILVSSNQTSKSYCPGDILEFETRYDWKIIAWDEYGYSTVGTTWYFITEENLPPNTPSEPNPADGETDVPIEKLLRWTGGDPNEGDKVYYDIYFGTSNPPPLVVENTLQNAYDPGTMELDTTYYWQIVSEDSSGATTDGPIWHFITESEPNQKPTPPDIDGPSNGKTGTELCWTFHSDDPDNHDVKYIIDWGDGNTEETDYYQSCTPVEVCHTYAEEGTYIIKARAEDTKEAQSDESTFDVKIPRTRLVLHQILFKFYDRLFNMFPIIRNLFGL
ncbi:MAG: hypothetical protein JSU91_06300, partial [Thermoplasmatales archaeon]